MTTHKSDTYNSGIMPDYTMPGVVLARTCKFVAEIDDIESADTLFLMQLARGRDDPRYPSPDPRDRRGYD